MFDTPIIAPMFPVDEPNQNSSFEELAAYALQKQNCIFARDKMNAHDLWLVGQALAWAKAKVGHAEWEKWWKAKGFKKTYVWQARKLHEKAATLEELKDLGVTEALVRFGVVKGKRAKPSVSVAKPTKDENEPESSVNASAKGPVVEPTDEDTFANESETSESAEEGEGTQEPPQQNETDDEPEEQLSGVPAKRKPKERQASFRTLSPNAKAVAILHALEHLRDDLNGQEVDDDLRGTFSQIAELATQLKGPSQEVECRLAG